MPDLTNKEHAFVNEYMAHGNGSKAVIAAGYSESGASVTANRLLKRAHVAAEIARRRRPSEKKSELNAQKVVDTLNNLVSFDIASLYDENGKLLKIHEMPIEARNAIASIDGDKVKLINRLSSTELAAKLLGMVKEQQTQQQAVQIIIAAPPAQPEVAPVKVQLQPEWE